MKSFCLNGYSGRQERWALDGHRWVAAEPRRNGFDLWGYQDDTPEILYLGGGAHDETATKLIYLALRNITKKCKNPPVTWKLAATQFAIQFGERFFAADAA
jgi:hypothetical protein